MKEARFWESLGDQKLQCHLCAHECQIEGAPVAGAFSDGTLILFPEVGVF